MKKLKYEKYKTMEFMKEQFDAGKNCADISKEFGIPYNTVSDWSRKFGLAKGKIGMNKGEKNGRWKGGAFVREKRWAKNRN